MLSNLQFTKFMYGMLFACELFGFPLASAIPTFAGVKSHPISIAYRGLVVLLTVILVSRALRQRWPLVRGSFVMAGSALAVLLIGRMVWDATFTDLPLNLAWSDQWTFLFGVTVVPTLAFIVVPPQGSFGMVRRVGLWIGCITIFMLIAAVLFALHSGGIKNLGGRLQTDVLNPISLAQMAVSCLILVNAQVVAGTSPKHRPWATMGRWSMTLICILLTLASVSKGPILAMFVIIVLAVLFGGRLDRGGSGVGLRVLVLAVALAAAVGVILLLDTYTPIQIASRFVNAGADASTSTRLDLIRGALSQFEASPLLGSAVVEYNSMFYPHNIIVEVLMTNGVLGLAALVWLLFGCFYYVGRILLTMPRERWIALLFVQYFVVAMFSGSLYLDASIWATMLMVLACVQVNSGVNVPGARRHVDPIDGRLDGGALRRAVPNQG